MLSKFVLIGEGERPQRWASEPKSEQSLALGSALCAHLPTGARTLSAVGIDTAVPEDSDTSPNALQFRDACYSDAPRSIAPIAQQPALALPWRQPHYALRSLVQDLPRHAERFLQAAPAR